MLKGLAKITRMPLGVGILLSAVLLLAWIPDFLPGNVLQGDLASEKVLPGDLASGNILPGGVSGNLGNGAGNGMGNGMDWREVVATMLLTLVNAFAIWLAAFRAGVVKSKDGLPVWLYLLAVTAMPIAHDCWRGQLAVLLLIGAMRLQYHTYKSGDAAENAFLATLLLCAASLAAPDLLWLVPLSWLAYLWLRSLNLRVWSATLLAGMAFGVVASIAILAGWIDCPYTDIVNRQWIFCALPTDIAATICGAVGLGLGWLILSVMNMWYDADKRRVGILLLGSGLVGESVCLLFAMPAAHLLPVFAMLYSGQALLYLRQRESMGRSIAYIVYIVAAILSYAIYTL